MKHVSNGAIIVISISLLMVVGTGFLLSDGQPVATGASSGSTATFPIPIGRSGQDTTPVGVQPNKENVNHAYFQQVRTYEERIAENPSDTTALRELGRLKQDAHQNESSETLYRQYLAINPTSRQVRLDLANVLASSGNWDGAREETEYLVEMSDEDFSAQYNLGAIAANLGDADTARRWWTRVREKSPDKELQDRATNSLARLAGHATR